MISYGYIRVCEGYPLETQRAEVIAHYKLYLTETEWGGIFEEELKWCDYPFTQRPQGYSLNLIVESGDRIIVPHAFLAFDSLTSALPIAARLDQRGVVLELLDLPNTAEVFAAIRQFDLHRQKERQAKHVPSGKKIMLLAAGRWPLKSAPYGFTIQSRPRRKMGAGKKDYLPQRKLIPCPKAREVGRQLVAWKRLGWSSRKIALHVADNGLSYILGTDGIYDKMGDDSKALWVRRTVDRWIRDELALQELEKQGRPYWEFIPLKVRGEILAAEQANAIDHPRLETA